MKIQKNVKRSKQINLELKKNKIKVSFNQTKTVISIKKKMLIDSPIKKKNNKQ